MKHFNKIIFTLIFFLLSSFCSKADEIYSNNYKLSNDSKIIVKDGTQFIKAKDFAKIVGASYTYNPSENSITIKTDNNTFKFTLNSDYIEINGLNHLRPEKIFINENSFMLPINLISSFFDKNISYDKSKNTIYVNSNAKNIVLNPEKEINNIKANVENALGDLGKNFTFNYLFKETVSNEKFLPDGTYFIFSAHEKGNVCKNVNGYFYFNIFTNEVYYYNTNAKSSNDLKKYSNKKEIQDFNSNNGKYYDTLIARTNMMDLLKKETLNDNISSYVIKKDIDKKYKDVIGNGEFTYFDAIRKNPETSKNEVIFQIAQNKDNLDLFLIYKDTKNEEYFEKVGLEKIQKSKTVNVEQIRVLPENKIIKEWEINNQ